MKTKRDKNRDKIHGNSNFYTSFPFLALCLVIIAGVLFFVWHQKSLEETTQQQEIFSQNLTEEIAIPEQVGGDATDPLTPQDTALTDGQTNKKTSMSDAEAMENNANTYNESTSSKSDLNISNLPENARSIAETSASKTSPSLSDDKQNNILKTLQCQETTQFIKDFFNHLDKQKYLNKYNIEPDSKTYFIALLQRTLDNPPIVSGETDDLYTILQNTAHFFRIIGNTNIVMLKNILSNEKAQFEDIAAKFYSLLTSQTCAEQSFGLQINKPSLYEYAGFFLNTMGGRLYLFRRDSISRMVISYYSILLIDRANIESFNKHGIELATSIDLLISEMESTTNTLKLKETYLNTLYALQEQYQ